MVLTYVVRERLADRIKQNDGYACLTNKVTDIYLNICHLLTFICCFDTGKTMTSFVNTIDILEHFDSTLKSNSAAKGLLKKTGNIKFLSIVYILPSCYLI